MSRGTRANSRSNVRSSNNTCVIVRAMVCVSASRVSAMNSGTARRGAAPRLAVPEFIALTRDAETQTIARTITQVLFDDLTFEREFALVPRDIYATIPGATSFTDVPFDRWREINADGLVIGTVQKVPTGIKIEVRLFDMRSRQPIPPSAFGKEYSGSAANP